MRRWTSRDVQSWLYLLCYRAFILPRASRHFLPIFATERLIMTSSQVPPALQPVVTPQQLEACYPLMRVLRPHLQSQDEFVTRIQRQQEEGYHLLTVCQDQEVLALAGYRFQENLV